MMVLIQLAKTIFISIFFIIATAEAANQKPIANAGIDQTVGFASNVKLSAAQSLDIDGTIKSYQWTQISGVKVTLKNAKTVAASFLSPKIETKLVFKLTVTDDKKAATTDTINVKIVEKMGCELPSVLENKICVDKSTQTELNDTGITFCSDGAFNVDSCHIASYPQQDAEIGRDFSNNSDKDGHAGFSFSKISATGEILPFNATVWSCVKDNVTGFLWEVKTIDNANSTYSLNETEHFVTEKNTQKFCGVNNWRLPQVQELQSIVDYSFPFPNPNIDSDFFPNSTNKLYWSQTPYAKNSSDNWAIYFDDGRIFEQNKNTSAAIRLISATILTPKKRYILSDDAQEVLDTQTNLIWRRCIEGMSWKNETCVGEPLGFMFQDALIRATNQTNVTGKMWRLPNVKELVSLLDMTQTNLAIDLTTFPATPNDQVWTASTYALDAFFGWMVHFYYGSSYYSYSEDTGVVRLVRDSKTKYCGNE